jgi:hypothetical protein
MRRLTRLCLPVLLLGLLSCSGSGDDGKVEGRDAGFRDAGPREVRVEVLDVDYERVAGMGTDSLIGDNLIMRQASDGSYVIAYGVVPAGAVKQEIHYATRSGPDTWSTEMVIRPAEAVPDASGTLVGLGFDLVNDEPHIAYLGGDDDGNVLSPFPTDLALATRGGGGWTERILVDTSGESAGTCTTLQDVCNFGNVVGSHPALRATGSGGFAVVFRDTHGGFAKDDLELADVEIYREGSGPVLVDPERGGGNYSDLAVKPDGSLIASYNLPVPDQAEDRLGVWVVYESGGTWERRRVSDAQTSARTGIAVASDGTVYVAFFDLGAGDLVLGTSTDGGDTWTVEAIDQSGKTGLHPSLALDPQDQPVIAYAYCGRTSDRDCPGSLNDGSEVRLARKEGGEWKLYRIDDGMGFGHVGLFTSIVVDADGKAAVAFQDERNSDLVFVKER